MRTYQVRTYGCQMNDGWRRLRSRLRRCQRERGDSAGCTRRV